MKSLKSRTIAILIAAILTISMGASTMLLQNAKATVGLNITTYGFINVGPSPIGVGQTAYINMWVDKPTPTANGAYGDEWQNLKVTVTKPDGTTQTLGPFISDDTGGTYTTYIPTTVGTYGFVFSFPGQTITGANPAPSGTSNPGSIGDYFEPCTSSTEYLNVQQTPIANYPSTPLPTSYWQTPVFAMNTAWYNLAGNWLGNGLGLRLNSVYNASEDFNPYTTGPSTAHIMWTTPFAIGGLIGGNYGSPPGSSEYTNYYSASQYEPKLAPPIVINGVLYYDSYPGASTSLEGWIAIDLFTGKMLWEQNITTTQLRCGQVLDYVTPNQYGGLVYLWGNLGTTWSMYDGMTGNWILNIINSPGGIQFINDPNGDMIAYYVNATAGTQIIQGTRVTTPTGGRMLECWNSSEAIQYPNGYFPGVTAVSWQWRPVQGSSIQWSSGIMWAAPVATTFTEPNGTAVAISPALSYPTYPDFTGNNLVLYSIPAVVGSGQLGWTSWQIESGYSLTNGAQQWIVNRTVTPFSRQSAANGANNGIYTEVYLESLSLNAFSSATGKQLWGPEYLNATGDEWGSYQTGTLIAYDTVFTGDLGGYVYAMNATTGALMWTWNTGNGTYATPYNIFPIWYLNAVGGGYLYVMGGHEYSPPLFSGAQLYCLNAATGKEVWSILEFPDSNNPSTALADGYLVVANAYDNQIYCFGQGPSKTTVNAPDVGVTTATPITLTGSVRDVSAGSKQEAVASDFPNGLPAVSDASMTQFMEAVYEQQVMPNNITGVPVTLSVLDSNNNYRVIGTTTTNALGNYAFTWSPDIAGNYTVYATFAGSSSYYGSSDSTGFYASAAAPTQAPTATPLSGIATQTTLMYGVIAIIIVLIIGIAVLAILMQRKRP
ncbi:MAG: PQQ-binding-like beta-propeller repeat protein [Candidatus Bathyarchaeia archaeon]|jgi:outer membrane protein assembly factor BamB